MTLPRPPLLLCLLVIACLVPEMVLLGADWGLWGSARWRPLAYANGAFWAGLLKGWQANYPGQAVLMFFSHALLHAGPAHAVGNALALWVAGRAVTQHLGTQGLGLVTLASVIGGGVAFGLLSHTAAPMVGASGAVFGLAAAWLWCAGAEAPNGRWWRRLAGLAGLVVLNLVTWAMLSGQLAWETHLGGVIGGILTASLLGRTTSGADRQTGGPTGPAG